jgi:hypothetical protein
MGAETVTCEKGNNYKLHKEHALTDKKDVSVNSVPVESTKAIVVFVGGAGDKESYCFSGSYGNIQEACRYFDQCVQDLATEGKNIDWVGRVMLFCCMLNCFSAAETGR